MEWTIVGSKKKKPPTIKKVKEIPMVQLKKPVIQQNTHTEKVNYSELNKLKKIEEETENFTVKRVPKDVSQEIVTKRLNKKWTQKELAQKCNLQVKDIQTIENGTAVYNGNLINKIKRILG